MASKPFTHLDLACDLHLSTAYDVLIRLVSMIEEAHSIIKQTQINVRQRLGNISRDDILVW